MAPATPSVAPATEPSSGAAAAAATTWREVMPTDCRTARSAMVAEVYLATAWPTRNSAATSAATANPSRQTDSYWMSRRTGSTQNPWMVGTSMSERPVTRARSARNAGMAAAPPFSRISALM
jgi:hypothetical protein